MVAIATAVLCLATGLALGLVALLIVRSRKKQGGTISSVSSRFRVFSQRGGGSDRLNTTEYMHSLATLDRKLAMNEILEKKQRALLQPEVRLDCDEVYVELGDSAPEH